MKLDEIKVQGELGNTKFTRAELTDVALFVHDKKHVMGANYKGRNKAFDKAIKMFSEKTTELWRGIYKEEVRDFNIGDTFSPKGYMSLSEHRKIAEGFAKHTKTMTLFHVKGVNGFPYWKWNIENIQLPSKKRNPEAFKNNDGEHDIKFLTSEAEWVIGHDTKFEVVSKTEADGFTIIELKEV